VSIRVEVCWGLGVLLQLLQLLLPVARRANSRYSTRQHTSAYVSIPAGGGEARELTRLGVVLRLRACLRVCTEVIAYEEAASQRFS
jgi:hypothetical protein